MDRDTQAETRADRGRVGTDLTSRRPRYTDIPVFNTDDRNPARAGMVDRRGLAAAAG